MDLAPGRWLGSCVALALMLVALGNVRSIARIIRTRRLRAHPERSPDQAAALWYERMAKYMARRGIAKSTTQTPREFVRAIEDVRLRTRVASFTDAYESARFGNSSDDVRKLSELFEAVESATKK